MCMTLQQPIRVHQLLAQNLYQPSRVVVVVVEREREREREKAASREWLY